MGRAWVWANASHLSGMFGAHGPSDSRRCPQPPLPSRVGAPAQARGSCPTEQRSASSVGPEDGMGRGGTGWDGMGQGEATSFSSAAICAGVGAYSSSACITCSPAAFVCAAIASTTSAGAAATRSRKGRWICASVRKRFTSRPIHRFTGSSSSAAAS